MIPSDLRVDNDPEPLGLDHGTPAFSWIPLAQGRNASQAAFRILVAGSPENLNRETGILWDSGRVTSDRTREILYSGEPLAPASIFWWKVGLWEAGTTDGQWCPPARFGTGLFQKSDWTADWIGRGPKTEPRLDFERLDKDFIKQTADSGSAKDKINVENESALLRTEFVITKPASRAFVYVCGLGFYRLRINGKRVGNNVHTPSKTDYRQQVQYDAYEVTGMLAEGKNAIGIVLGNGWYNPNKRWWDWHMQWHGSKRAILQLHVQHHDGSETRIDTDGSWNTALGPVREHCLYDGERYDARLEQPGWDQVNFNDKAWTPANVVDEPGGELRFHSIEPIRAMESIRPKSMWEAAPGVFIFDMAQNFSGVARVTASGPRGAEISLRHAENIHPDGTLDVGTNNLARNLDRFILKGEGTEVFEPVFVYHGFRYVEMRGFPRAPTLDSLLGVVIHTASPQTGEFQCANGLINHIHRCTVWSQRSNMMGLPTDDNQRDERLGWMADGHLAAEQFMHNFEPARFHRKWLRDMKCGQDPQTGSVPYIVPRPYFSPASHTAAWSSAYPLVTWYLYQHTGDRSLLEEHLDPVSRYVDYLSTLAEDHILPKDRYGDHLSIADGHDRGEPLLASTWFYYYDALLASRMAAALGREPVESKYAALASSIRSALNERYFSPAACRYGAGTQCEQIMPLWLEMEPDDEREKLLGWLIGNIMHTNHAHLRVGILGAKYAIDLLMAENRNDVLWDLATRTDYPSFGYMTEGYTTLSETWNRTGTNNHVMWGHIDTWLYQGLAGIRPATPGYGRILIQPFVPAGLGWVSAAITTVRGRISSAWKRAGETLKLEVSIPANTSAEIRLPLRSIGDSRILEGEQTVWHEGFREGVDGVTSGACRKDCITLNTGSGSYHFSCRWRDNPR